MRTIGERELALFISLLAGKTRDLKQELAALESLDEEQLSDDEMENQYQLQEIIEQYENILGELRDEYEAGLTEGVNLPSYDELTRAFKG